MSVKPLDTLLAIKAISVASGLKPSDRRIGTAILEHFNRKTGQCDPGLERIATLTQFSTRTVIRAADRLVIAGILRKHRHGGHLGRNRYEPNWTRLRAIACEWDRAFMVRGAPKQRGSECHMPGDSRVTQTYSSNLKEEAGGKGKAPRPARPRPARARPASQASSVVAASAAERRWHDDLRRQLDKDDYIAIVPRIDSAIEAAATRAEIAEPGTGIAVILVGVRPTPGGIDA